METAVRKEKKIFYVSGHCHLCGEFSKKLTDYIPVYAAYDESERVKACPECIEEDTRQD